MDSLLGVVEAHAFHPPSESTYSPKSFNSFLHPLHEFGNEAPMMIPIHYLFYLAGSGKMPSRSKPFKMLRKTTILYFHGNACDIGSLKNYGRQMSKMCDTNFVAVEYPGYGCSRRIRGRDANELARDISPSEKWTYFAGEAILHELSSVWGIKESDVVLMGKSIGSGPAVEFACQPDRKFLGLIIDSGFTSCVRIAYKLPKFLQAMFDNTVDIFVNIKKLPNVQCKTMIIHAQKDRIVPLEHAQQNWDAIPEEMRAEFVTFDHASHNTVELLYDETNTVTDKMNPKYTEGIREFLVQMRQ